jgi:hypothetical protein
LRNIAARDYLGIDTAIAVAVSAQQRLRHIEVADAGLRIDVGGRATHNALDHFEPDAGSGGQNLAEEEDGFVSIGLVSSASELNRHLLIAIRSLTF